VEESTNFFTKVGCYGVNRQYPLIDIGIATAHLCLAATDEGLDTHVIGWYNEKKFSNLLRYLKIKKLCWLLFWDIPMPKFVLKKERK
jgi:nitroreductase